MTALLLLPALENTLEKLEVCPSIYVKEMRCVVPESSQDPMEALHKQLSLRFAEQTDFSKYKLHKPPHTSCLAWSYHIYSLMSVSQGLCVTKPSFHRVLWNKDRLKLLFLSYSDLTNPKPRFVCLQSYRSPQRPLSTNLCSSIAEFQPSTLFPAIHFRLPKLTSCFLCNFL